MTDEKKSAVARLWDLALTLTGSKGLSVLDLGGNTPAKARQVQLDLNRLQSAGFAVRKVDEKARTPLYFIEAVTRKPSALLNTEETLAMTLAIQSAGDSEVGQRAKAAWTKLHYAVINGVEKHIQSDLPARLSSNAPQTLPIDQLTVICSALLDSKRLRLLYQGLNDTQPRWRTVEPRRQFFQDRWYLSCWDLETALLKNFRLDRISEIEETGESFVLDPKDRASDPHFHKWDLTDGEPVSVLCEVDAPLARWLAENPVHPSQELDSCRLRVKVRDVDALLRWVCSLTYCRVLEPVEVRQKLRERLLKMTGDQDS
jgi:predicted DNA-binding transcriptional regulator YafY